jgi:hypothetical protein
MEWKDPDIKCPACGAVAPAKALECVACGVNFAKWLKKAMREEVPSGRSLEEPRPVLVRETDSSHDIILRVAGFSVLLAAVSLAGWFASGGSSRAPVAGAAVDQEHGYSMSVPSDWKDSPEESCGGTWGSCTIRRITRGEKQPDQFPEHLSVRVIPRGPDALSFSGRTELEEKLKDEIRAEMGDGSLAPVMEKSYDGIEGFRLEGRGMKHFKIETSPAVVTNAQAALAALQRQNPNRGMYTVMANFGGRSPNGTVTLKEAEYAVFDARPVLGRVVVPARSSLLVVAYQYDEVNEKAFVSGLDEALSSLRVLKRPRPMDGMDGARAFLVFGLAAGLAVVGVRLIRA